MKMEHRSHQVTSTGRPGWLQPALFSFTVGACCGVVCVFALHWIVFRDFDPFAHGWPLLLEISALVLSAIIAFFLRCPGIAPLGLYSGLVTAMFAHGGSEYPLISTVALGVHGLVPAALGLCLGLLAQRFIRAIAGRQS